MYACWGLVNLARYRVSVDIGGTFTDLVALEEETGKIINIKVSSMPRNPAEGVIKAFQKFFQHAKPESVSVVSHATTIAVNALLGQLGLELPKSALITTKGFRDIIEIGRQRRHELYNLFVQKPRVLIARRFRYVVDERIGPRGEVLKPLDKEEVKSLAEMLKRENFKSVAVALLFSYMNPMHEREIKKILVATCPRIFVSVSSEVAPEHREYERTSTTVVNACLMPIVSTYLSTLTRKIRELGVNAPFCVMRSDGGLASKDIVVSKPVSMVESGPAAGVMASAFYGKLLKIRSLLSFDMGGTTAKAGLVQNGVPEVVTEYEVAGKVHSGRIVKGSGYPVRFPFIDLAECSAGGGTIAWIDAGGALRVGPLSAGANPGPACYGKGGQNPTVTDANLVLGRLNPFYMLGGKMRIHAELAEKAIKKQICEILGLELVEAAAGIIRIVNSEMAKILRIVSVERGYDPRKFTMMCFGGAGPMHACALAEELGISKIVVPMNPGMFSAYGLLTADFKCSLVKAIMKTAGQVEHGELDSVFKQLQAKGIAMLRSQRVASKNLSFLRQFEMRYVGQAYELSISAPSRLTRNSLKKVVEKFHNKHESIYGYAIRDAPVELVNARLTVIGLTAKPPVKRHKLYGRVPSKESVLTKRDVFFEKHDDYVKTNVYLREKLEPGNIVEGPAVIEQYDATTVLYPDWTGYVDEFGNIVMCVKK